MLFRNAIRQNQNQRFVRPEQYQQFLTGESYGTTLLVLFIDTFGTEALQWHPQTIREELEATFGVKLTQGNFDRLLAAITIVTTDLFYTNLGRFIQLCNVLSGSLFDPTVFDPADSIECAWGCTEALLLDPPDDPEKEVFSDEIRYYIGHVLKEEGFIKPPSILSFALGADFTQKAQTFADDPELFQSIYLLQQEKTREVEEIVADNLAELMRQLKVLPLTNGNTDDLEGRVVQMLRRLVRTNGS